MTSRQLGQPWSLATLAKKVEYVPFEQGSRTSLRWLKKPAMLDVPSDENMLVQFLYLAILSGDEFLMLAFWV